jgi:hypothetical protein
MTLINLLNPFKGLIETKKYPHSRAHRTTFSGKMKDTFAVFSGRITPNYKNNNLGPFKKFHVGVFDYLTLGIHFIISELLLYLTKKAANSLPILISLAVLTFIFNIPRLLFAGIMTLICLPFIGVAHAFSREKGNKSKDEILSYTMRTDE